MRYVLIPRCWCRSCLVLATGPRVVCVDHKALWWRFLPGSLRYITDRSGLCRAVKTVADGTMQLGPRHRRDTCTAGNGGAPLWSTLKSGCNVNDSWAARSFASIHIEATLDSIPVVSFLPYSKERGAGFVICEQFLHSLCFAAEARFEYRTACEGLSRHSNISVRWWSPMSMTCKERSVYVATKLCWQSFRCVHITWSHQADCAGVTALILWKLCETAQQACYCINAIKSRNHRSMKRRKMSQHPYWQHSSRRRQLRKASARSMLQQAQHDSPSVQVQKKHAPSCSSRLKNLLKAATMSSQSHLLARKARVVMTLHRNLL